jgi:hypothetical protein
MTAGVLSLTLSVVPNIGGGEREEEEVYCLQNGNA